MSTSTVTGFQLHRTGTAQHYETTLAGVRYSVDKIGNTWFGAVCDAEGGRVITDSNKYAVVADDLRAHAFNLQQSRQDALLSVTEGDDEHWVCDIACLTAGSDICTCHCQGVNHQLAYVAGVKF